MAVNTPKPKVRKATKVKKATSKQGTKKVVSKHDKEKSEYRKEVRAVFIKASFARVTEVSDKEFKFRNIYTTDFDDVFIYENVIVFLEYTVTQTSGIGDHLKPKKVVYDAIVSNKDEFLEFYGTTFPSFAAARDPLYDNSQTQVIILYCPKNQIEATYKQQVSSIKYLEYPTLKYFKAIADAVKHSSKYEFLKFLGVGYGEIGKNVFDFTATRKEINGTILPETHSNFRLGYKVVSFYIDPLTLLTNSYVLRKDGWQDEAGLYQRMISRSKVLSIRRYLINEKRVFINNIIVTLPATTVIYNTSGKEIDPASLNKTTHIRLQIPNEFNVIGLIDGQHRIFAYHEGGEKDEEIGKLRIKQNLLATGIIYPTGISETEKSRFEANLFLEINSTQTNAKSDLKQAISLILNPFSTESIASAVINKLNTQGPLAGNFERYFFEKDKLKTTSIVSYGLKPIVKLTGTDSLFHLWTKPNKHELISKNDENLLKEYVQFCVQEINIFLGAVREGVGKQNWTIDRTNKTKMLSTTTINGFIVLLRKVIENNKTADFNTYKSKLLRLSSFNFTQYKSSQYGAMGRDMYDKYFSK